MAQSTDGGLMQLSTGRMSEFLQLVLDGDFTGVNWRDVDTETADAVVADFFTDAISKTGSAKT
jgi:hypothetical protein